MDLRMRLLMATPGFGEPEYAAGGGSGAAQADAPSRVLDPNDPSLTSEVLSEDTTQDAYAIPPPPPDGKWRAKLKLVDIKDGADGQMKRRIVYVHPNMNDGKPFFAVNVEASLIDVHGKFDGVKMTEYWVKSSVDRRKNVSQMTTITKAAGGTPVEKGTQADRVNQLEKTLAGEPEVVLDTFWEAACQTCQESAKKSGGKAPRAFKMGMSHFPQPRAGEFDPVVECPTCKTPVRAQLRIGQFFNVKDAKATRGTA